MKALSLHQPWASLVVHGLKAEETRGPRSPQAYRGPLLIHAAKVLDAEVYARLWNDFMDVRYALPCHASMPLGAIVGRVNVAEIRVMTADLIAGMSERERAFGDWQPGRFAWRLTDARAVCPPINVRGRQGLFDVTVDDVAACDKVRFQDLIRGDL